MKTLTLVVRDRCDIDVAVATSRRHRTALHVVVCCQRRDVLRHLWKLFAAHVDHITIDLQWCRWNTLGLSHLFPLQRPWHGRSFVILGDINIAKSPLWQTRTFFAAQNVRATRRMHPRFPRVQEASFAVVGDDVYTWMPSVLQAIQSSVTSLCLDLDACARALRMVFRTLQHLAHLRRLRIVLNLEPDDLLTHTAAFCVPPLQTLEVVLGVPTGGHRMHEWACAAFAEAPARVARTFLTLSRGGEPHAFTVGNVTTNSEQFACLLNCRWFRNTERVVVQQQRKRDHR